MKTLKGYFGHLGLFLLAAFFMFSACKKDGVKPPNHNDDSTNTGIPSDKLTAQDVDSLKFYTWYINESDSANIPFYFWNDQVPKDFPWYSSQYATGTQMLDAMRSYAKVDGKKVDHYSFLDLKGTVSGELEGGVQGDYGYMVASVQEQNGDPSLYIEYTYKGSPSAQAGISKGDKITSIDENSNMDLSNKANYDRINKSLFTSKSVDLVLMKPDSSTFTASLQPTQYHLNPVLFDSIYTVSGQKVGYFVYNSFVSVVSSQNGNTAKSEIDAAFSKFNAANVKNLIVDLRYNGGGSVASAEYLDNLIGASKASGGEMYRYKYNQPLTDLFNSTDTLKMEYIDPVHFISQSNSLNIDKVFFIVSRGTASAAELTMNNLKPYFGSNEKLIGDTTYGKPVGFFTIPISFDTKNNGYQHVADMYAINFQSLNSNNKGDFYSGIAPDYVYRYFNVSNWGDDSRDARLHAALNYIKNGSFERSFELQRKVSPSQQLRIMPENKIKNPHQFKGMVDYRKKMHRFKK